MIDNNLPYLIKGLVLINTFHKGLEMLWLKKAATIMIISDEKPDEINDKVN